MPASASATASPASKGRRWRSRCARKARDRQDEPAQACNKAQGVIEDIAYFGSHSVYHVRLPSGVKLMANFANRQRWASEALTWGDTVWVGWGEDDGVVFTA